MLNPADDGLLQIGSPACMEYDKCGLPLSMSVTLHLTRVLQELVMRKSRLRLTSTRQDRLIKQSMQQACVGVTAEYIVETPHHEESLRVPLMGIYMIQDGKVGQFQLRRPSQVLTA